MSSALQRLHGRAEPPEWTPPRRPPIVATVVDDADLDGRDWRALVLLSGAGAVLGLVAAMSGSVAALPIALAGPLVAALRVLGWRHRAHRRLESSIPGFLDRVARELRSGGTVRTAIARVDTNDAAVLVRRLETTRRLLTLGADTSRALAHFGHEGPGSNAATASVVLDVASTSGSGADVLEHMAETLRLADRLRLEVHAVTAQARLSAQVMVVLPAAWLALGLLFGSSQMADLFTSPVGRACLLAGVVLDLLGARWLSAMTSELTR